MAADSSVRRGLILILALLFLPLICAAAAFAVVGFALLHEAVEALWG